MSLNPAELPNLARESVSPTASLISRPSDFIFANAKPPHVKDPIGPKRFRVGLGPQQSSPHNIKYPVPMRSTYQGVGGELYDMTGRNAVSSHPPLHLIPSPSVSPTLNLIPTPPSESRVAGSPSTPNTFGSSSGRWEYGSPTPSRKASEDRTEVRSSRYEGRRAQWIIDLEKKRAQEERRGDEERFRIMKEKQIELLNEEMRHNHKKEALEVDSSFSMDSPKSILYALRRYCLSKPVHKFKDLFMQYDEDGNGTLDLDEICHGIQSMGFDIDFSKARDVMKMIDLDGNERLDFAEFRCAILDERIAKDFEEHERRLHNDCKLQDEYRERCMKDAYSASLVGPACRPKPSKGHIYHYDMLQRQKEGIMAMMTTTKEATMIELEIKRVILQAELIEERRRTNLLNGTKDSTQKKDFIENLDTKFKNLRQAFSKMDKDNSGALDREEMKMVCVSLNVPENWTDALIADADIDGDGEISYTEFVKALHSKSEEAKVEESTSSCLDWDHDGEPKQIHHESLLQDLMGNVNYREGPPVPEAKRKAGGWDKITRQTNNHEPLLFSAHSSHIDIKKGGMLPDGISTLCTRPLSHNIKASAPNFLK